MSDPDIKIYTVTEESFSIVDNYFSPEDLEKIRIGKFSAIAGVLEDTVDGVLLFEVKDDRAILIHGISVATNVDRAIVRDGLIQWITEAAKENDLFVICSFKEDEEMEQIFLKYGYDVKPSVARDMTISFEEVKNLKYYLKTETSSKTFGPEKLTTKLLNRFRTSLADPSLFDVSYSPGKIQKYIFDGEEIGGCIIGAISDEHNCSIDYVYIMESCKLKLLSLLKAFINEVLIQMKTERFDIHFASVNEAAVGLAEKLFEGKAKKEERKNAISIGK